MEGRNEGERNVLMSYVVTGTLDNPIMVNSFGDEQYAGCTGFPADSHWVIWLVVCPRLSLFPLLSSPHSNLYRKEKKKPTNPGPRSFTDLARPPDRTLSQLRQCTQNELRRSAYRSERTPRRPLRRTQNFCRLRPAGVLVICSMHMRVPIGVGRGRWIFFSGQRWEKKRHKSYPHK